MAKNEAEIALQKVEEAEKEVSELKAQKAAKRAARCAKRLTWKGPFKLVGRLFNQYDEHPVEVDRYVTRWCSWRCCCNRC